MAPDDPERIRAVLAPCLDEGGSAEGPGKAARCDLVLTLGGSHKGDFDFVHTVLERLGAELRFDRIRMTPGGSTIFATHGRTLLFGLPGTPAASWVAFETLVRPALWKLAGRRRLDPARLTARLAAPLPEAPGRTQFVACRLDLTGAEPHALPIQGKHTHEAPAALRADGLIHCPEEQPLPAVGSRVSVDWVAD